MRKYGAFGIPISNKVDLFHQFCAHLLTLCLEILRPFSNIHLSPIVLSTITCSFHSSTLLIFQSRWDSKSYKRYWWSFPCYKMLEHLNIMMESYPVFRIKSSKSSSFWLWISIAFSKTVILFSVTNQMPSCFLATLSIRSMRPTVLFLLFCCSHRSSLNMEE